MRFVRVLVVAGLVGVFGGATAGADIPDGGIIFACYLKRADPPLPKGNLRVIDYDNGERCGPKQAQVQIQPVAVSDRNMKQDFASVDDARILALVGKLPVSSWTYKGETIRHIGPMAQDFHKFFAVGNDGKTLAPVDMNGINLAATKALNGEVRTQQREIFALGVLLVLLMVGFGVYVTRVRSAR